ncbi:hypothetical protein XANCAGTX0491_000393 [Xanthoria calcicola]
MLPEPAKRRQGRVLLDTLYSKTPPVVDFNAVETIQSFAELRHEPDPRMDILWMQAANAQPTDEQLHRHWFLSRFRMRDWQGARKAGMTYTKHFPNKRDPFFWTIFANFMASRTLPDENSEKQLCGTMAYRMCAKAAEAVVLDRDQELKNGRVIRNLDDIVFLLDVYESQRKYEEAIEILESDRTGISSRIGRRSWKLVTSKIRLLGSAHRWLDQFKFCFELLEDASPVNGKTQVHGFGKLGNDGYVWTTLVNATLSLKLSSWTIDGDATDAETSETAARGAIDQNFYKNTRLAVASLLDDYQMDRNAMCAGMYWATKLARDVQGEKLATKAFEYFETYGNKTFCFNDLQSYVGAMQTPVIQCFLHKVRAWLMGRGYGFNHLNQDKPFDRNTLMAKTNALKLEYCLIYSRDEESDDVTNGTSIETFIVECLNCYGFALENSENNAEKPREIAERFPGDDAGLVAAAALLKFDRKTQNGQKLRAMILLDELIARSPAMYEVFGTLILLYVRVGAGSLAARTYHGLSIKNIQLPTLSWLLWTRLSTIHPHRSQFKDVTLPNDVRVSKGEADPVQHLMQALDYHMHLQETDQQEILEFLEAKQYASLHRAIRNSRHNLDGFVKYLLCTEWARTKRISGLHHKCDYRTLFNEPANTYDNRDESSVPHWEHPDSTPLLLEVMPGEWPTVEWLSHQMTIAHTFEHVTNGSEFKPKSIVNPNPTTYSEAETSMTREEHSQYQTAVECQSLLNLFESQGVDEAARTAASWSVSASFESIEKRQQAVNDELATIPKRESRYLWAISDQMLAPSWLFFHVCYTNLDTIILIRRTLDTVEIANRKHRILDLQSASDQIMRIRKLCDKLHVIIHDVAVKLYEDFSSDRYLEPMVHSIIGQPSDPCEKDPIAHWLRHHFDRGTDDAGKAAEAYVMRLSRAWCEALRNLCKLASPS